METTREKMAFEIASQRVKEIKKFYSGLIIFILVSLALAFWHYQKTGHFDLNLGRSFIMMVWAVIIAIRGAKLFLFNSDWEQRKMKELMSKEQHDL